MALLIIALDQTILATALPRIASDFGSFSFQGWVASSFELSQTVFILFFGQVMRIFPAKHMLLINIFVFEAGSLVCALSANVYQLIVGRTVSGVAAAGICEYFCKSKFVPPESMHMPPFKRLLTRH